MSTDPKEPEVMVISRKQWELMERFRKGETTGDVILLPPSTEPPVPAEQPPPR